MDDRSQKKQQNKDSRAGTTFSGASQSYSSASQRRVDSKDVRGSRIAGSSRAPKKSMKRGKTRIVIDASVLVRWVLPLTVWDGRDRLVAEGCQRFMTRALIEGAVFIVPPRWYSETTSAINQTVLRNKILDQKATLKAARQVLRLPVVVKDFAIEPVLAIAWAIGKYKTYDFEYVVLAHKYKAELVTADDTLYNSLPSKMLFPNTQQKMPKIYPVLQHPWGKK
jgi:predicted nucleic acid-binding protein